MVLKVIGVCYIFTAFGEIQKLRLPLKENDFIIAADGGYDNAKKMGLLPHLVVGDFDSLHISNVEKGIEIIKHPIQKDDTDTILAIREGLKRGYKEFVLLGGIGGRLDHTLANISALKFILQGGARGKITDNETEIILLKNEKLKIQKNHKNTVSVFAFSEIAKGVTLKGLTYPLTGATVNNGFPIGVSNSFKEDFAEISVDDGELLVIIANN